VISGQLTRKRIRLTNDYAQAGQRFRLMGDWERDDLVNNFVTLISAAVREVQERMVWHFLMVDDELGIRVGEGLGITPDDVRHLEPLASQTLSDAELERVSNLGKTGPRNVDGITMTHCVPNEHVVVSR
jgi:catalase